MDFADEGSLADAFRERKQQMIEKLSEKPKPAKKEKTKEELAELRKQMMKRPSVESKASVES